MRTSKMLAVAGMAALAAPAAACDLEAYGEQRFSAFGGIHMGAPPAPEPVSAPAPPEQQQQGGRTDEASTGDHPSDDSGVPIEGSDGTGEPASVLDGQGDAATFR